jgi:hypothetical protein
MAPPPTVGSPGVDGDVPALRQLADGADVIDVAMRQDDRGGTRPVAEAALGLTDDRPVGGGEPGVDEHPAPVPGLRRPHEIDVDDRQLETGHVAGDPRRPPAVEVVFLEGLVVHVAFSRSAKLRDSME